MPGCVAKTPDNVAKRLADRVVDALKVGPEVREPRSQELRQEVGQCTDENDDGVAVPDRVGRASESEAAQVGEGAALGEMAFAVTRSSLPTTWGMLAESAASKNRFTEKAVSTRR